MEGTELKTMWLPQVQPQAGAHLPLKDFKVKRQTSNLTTTNTLSSQDGASKNSSEKIFAKE